jgi:hypothetical protein
MRTVRLPLLMAFALGAATAASAQIAGKTERLGRGGAQRQRIGALRALLLR